MGGYSIPVEFGYVDVDDVALAHLRAIEVTEADGHRIIIAESQIMWQEMQKELASIANETTTGVEKNISSRQVPYFICWLGAKITQSSPLKIYLEKWNHKVHYNNQKSKNLLGINYTARKVGFTKTVNYFISINDIPNLKPRAKL